MQFLKVNGVTLHHQVISAAAGKPRLVFVNSLGTDFRIWRDIVVRLAGDFAILTYDARGHGLSDIGDTPYSIETLGADLAALIDATSFGPAIICGVSVGGLTAQALYEMRPDLVSALILCDTAHKIGTDDAWNQRIAIVEKDGIEAVADTVLKGWFTEPWRNTEPAMAGFRAMLTRTPPAGYLATVAAIRDSDFTALAPKISVPTLALGGEVDIPTPPKLMQEFAKLIPDARYELIRNAGHIPMVEQPEVVSAIIHAFADFVGVETHAAKRH